MVNSRIKMDNGVTISTPAAEEFGGECNRRTLFYISTVWMAGLWSMVTNLIQGFSIKIFKKQKTPISRILWDMGRDPKHFSCFFGDRFSHYNHLAKVGAASWRALDLFYNYYEKIEPQLDQNMEAWLTGYWIEKMENRQAVTNRLKLVIKLLAETLFQFNDQNEIKILSIASGSAQAVVEAIKKYPGLPVKVVLIDSDPSAIKEAEKAVAVAGFTDKFSFICNTTTILEEVCRDFSPHIIEMVGFLDYRPKTQAIRLIRRIKDLLATNGVFLTANIRKNREKIFLDWLLLWPLIYRDEIEFSELLIEGGFLPENIQLIYEPFRIHGLAVCKK